MKFRCQFNKIKMIFDFEKLHFVSQVLNICIVKRLFKFFNRKDKHSSDIRSKIFYFYLQRYSRLDKRKKLPKWILQFLESANMNMSSDRAVVAAQDFFKKIAQPVKVFLAEVNHHYILLLL